MVDTLVPIVLLVLIVLAILLSHLRWGVALRALPDPRPRDPDPGSEQCRVAYLSGAGAFSAGHKPIPSGYPVLRLELPCRTLGSFVLTQATSPQTLSMWVEPALDTREDFDREFSLRTNVPGFCRLYFASATKRRAARKLFRLGFTRIDLDGENLVATWANYPDTSANPQEVERASQCLACLASDLPDWPPALVSRMLPVSVSGVVFSLLFSVGGMFALSWGCAMHPLSPAFDADPPFPEHGRWLAVFALLGGIVAMVLLFLGVAGWTRREPERYGNLRLTCFLVAPLVPIVACWLAVWLNATFDSGPPQVHIAMPNQLKFESGVHRATIPHWQPDRLPIRVKIQPGEAAMLEQGKALRINVRRGLFGYEWIASVEVVPANAQP
jgi:hypothetical protein